MQFCFEGVHGIKLSVIVDVKSQYPLVSETKYKEICLLGFNQKSGTALFHMSLHFCAEKLLEFPSLSVVWTLLKVSVMSHSLNFLQMTMLTV